MKKWLIRSLWIISIIILGITIFYIISTNNTSTCNTYTEGYVCMENTCELIGQSGCNPKPIGHSTIEECELNCGD